MIADLHIHSKYSRATSRDCDVEHLDTWAKRKGIAVVGTGDFTHPAWIKELEEELEEQEPGLFCRKQDSKLQAFESKEKTHFVLQTEISTIYKKDGKTRKVHHVVFVPSFHAAKKLTEALSRIGNLKSDGRPILGLDSEVLLEMVLASDDGSFLIPAHIWTPWFSALGAKSGFDSIEECYGILSKHIFAVETGLSSDPPMNWLVSSLDKYRLVSNSDAHSPSKLGREACVFHTDMDYFAMRAALETGNGYGGTLEFFPEEGKYHMDGHRKCNVCLSPEETLALNNICPECKKPLTIGVLNRVQVLSDRKDGKQAPQRNDFESLIPLCEILGEMYQVGPKSKRVQAAYDKLLLEFGSELGILRDVPTHDLGTFSGDLFQEGIERLRAGRVIRQPGFDGEYGVIRLFSHKELQERLCGGMLFADESNAKQPRNKKKGKAPKRTQIKQETKSARAGHKGQGAKMTLDTDQAFAAKPSRGSMLIIAGPGTGKTQTLTLRIANIILNKFAAPDQCLAITFTRKAAEEMQHRLRGLLGHKDVLPYVTTFHGLGLGLLREFFEGSEIPQNFVVAPQYQCCLWLKERLCCTADKANQFLKKISQAKRTHGAFSRDIQEAFEAYACLLKEKNAVDFDDLLLIPVALLEKAPKHVQSLRKQYPFVFVDEYQDIDPVQYALLKLLVPKDGNLCAIGDPNQSIYGFRGSDVRLFVQMQRDFSKVETVQLKHNYRSSKPIVEAAVDLMQAQESTELAPLRIQALIETGPSIQLHEAATERAEAEFVVSTIESLLGGHSFFSIDSGRTKGHSLSELSFSDIAILFRTERQVPVLREALDRAGMPVDVRSEHRLTEHPIVQQLLVKMEQNTKSSVTNRLSMATDVVLQEGPSENVPTDYFQHDVHQIAKTLYPLAEQAGDRFTVFQDHVALGMDVDLFDPRADRISLLTLHASKGLEFEVVFLVGAEHGLIPLCFGNQAPQNLDEEQRLFFVGMTRAKTQLIFSCAKKRKLFGRMQLREVSPFVRMLKKRLDAVRQRPISKKQKDPCKQLDLFG